MIQKYGFAGLTDYMNERAVAFLIGDPATAASPVTLRDRPDSGPEACRQYRMPSEQR